MLGRSLCREGSRRSRSPWPGGAPDAKLDLQAMLDAAYRGGSYDLQLDYANPRARP